MIERKTYLDQLSAWKDEKVIKVITGIRRCGKSSLLCSVMDELRERGIAEGNICYINLDRREYQGVNTPEKLDAVIVPCIAFDAANIAWASQLQRVTCSSTKYRT